MGPIELADQVGLDICLAVGDMLRSKFGDLLPPTPAWLRDKVASGELGRKTGKGFYVWKDGRAERARLERSGAADAGNDRPADPADLERMRRLSARGHRRERRPGRWRDDFRTGYAPFRGGPLNYARSRGPENVVSDACARWSRSSAAGSRRTPAGIVSMMACDFQIDGTAEMIKPKPFTRRRTPRSSPAATFRSARLAMPADTNQNGDIFGGWLLSQMDIGGGIFASKVAKSRTVTVAVEAMNFRKPVFVGDVVSVHANLVRIGKTSGHRPPRSLGDAPQGDAFNPGDGWQFYLRRRSTINGRPQVIQHNEGAGDIK